MAYTFNNASVKLNSTDPTAIYSAPNNAGTDRAIVLSILVTNIDGTNAADITVIKLDEFDTEQSRIAHTVSVPADGVIELIPNKLVLKAGEKLQAIASAADDLDITLSAMEIV